MGWRDRLRPASFKGIKFFVEDHEFEFGRRVVGNEYPFRDVPYSEDMGRRIRSWNLTAYVLGKNYMTTRDALISAIEAGGSGLMVHPFLGTKTVIAEVGRLRETQREGGYAQIQINFVEAGTKQFPSGVPVPSILTGLGADTLIGRAQSLFEGGLTLDGVSQFVTDAYSGGLGQVADIFEGIELIGGINVQTTIAKINQAAEWVTGLAELRNPSLSLLGDFGGVASRIISLFRGVIDLGGSSKDSGKNLSRFDNFTLPRTPSITQEGAFVNNNAEVIERFVRTVSIANESKTIVTRPFSYYEEAVAARDTLLARIDEVSYSSTDDQEYDALQNLRKQVGDAVPADAQKLPKLDTLVLPQVMPSLAVTYDLYETLEREPDLIARNNIRNPNFMPGGSPLEILKDG